MGGLTDEHLARIERCANAATEGVELYLKWDGSIVECGVGGRFEPNEHDVELYVHAKHYITELLAELRELRALLAVETDVVEYIEQLKQIAERWNNTEARPTDVIPVMKALPDLLIALEAAQRERDEMAAKVLSERNEKWQDVMKHGRYVQERVERETAERIATWLDEQARVDRWAKAAKDYSADIRAGRHRPDGGGSKAP